MVSNVKRGSLSWGSCPSSGLSPNADNVSPSNLSVRPSSGGSDTRPSTSSSEPSFDKSVAWGATRPSTSCNVEKMVFHFSKNGGFSFNSRDIPTLDSQKDKCGRNNDSQVSAPNVVPASSVEAQGGQKQSAKRMDLAQKWERQLKKEEEERIREQEEARPEEFNRLTKAVDDLIQNLQRSVDPHEQALASNPDDQEGVVTDSKHASQVSAGNNSKSKNTSYNQKLNIQVDDVLTEKSIPTGTAEAPKRQSVMVVNDIPPSEVTCEIGSSFESNSSDKLKSSTESGKNACQIGLDPSTIHSVSNVVADAIQYSEPHIAEPDAVTTIVVSNTNVGQNIPERKRAEMERYVPKTVDKEHAQHGRIRQPTHSSIGKVHNGCTSIFKSAIESVRVQNLQQGSSSALNQRKDLHISRGRPYYPNQGLVSTGQSASGAGFCSNRSHSYRSGRDCEPRGDWSSAWSDNRQRNVPAANRQQRGENSSFESNNFQGPSYGSRGVGSKYID